MAQPNQPTPERAAQGAGKSIPIEDDRPADAKAQPQARPAAAEAAPQGEAIEAEVIEDAGPSADEQVAQAKAEAQDWQDKYLRLHAEWDTYRRRTTEQREVEKARATEKLVTSLLPVIDDFERTIDYATKNGEGGLFDGVKAVHAKLVDVLKKDGVEVIDPAGEAFDALEAQAVATVDDASVPDETVSEVYQRGYKMGNESFSGPANGNRHLRRSQTGETAGRRGKVKANDQSGQGQEAARLLVYSID